METEKAEIERIRLESLRLAEEAKARELEYANKLKEQEAAVEAKRLADARAADAVVAEVEEKKQQVDTTYLCMITLCPDRQGTTRGRRQ